MGSLPLTGHRSFILPFLVAGVLLMSLLIQPVASHASVSAHLLKHIEGDSVALAVEVAGIADSHLHYEQSLRHVSNAGQSNISQGGTIVLGWSGYGVTAWSRVRFYPQSRIVLLIKLFDGKTLLLEQSFDLSGKEMSK